MHADQLELLVETGRAGRALGRLRIVADPRLRRAFFLEAAEVDLLAEPHRMLGDDDALIEVRPREGARAEPAAAAAAIIVATFRADRLGQLDYREIQFLLQLLDLFRIRIGDTAVVRHHVPCLQQLLPVGREHHLAGGRRDILDVVERRPGDMIEHGAITLVDATAGASKAEVDDMSGGQYAVGPDQETGTERGGAQTAWREDHADARLALDEKFAQLGLLQHKRAIGQGRLLIILGAVLGEGHEFGGDQIVAAHLAIEGIGERRNHAARLERIDDPLRQFEFLRLVPGKFVAPVLDVQLHVRIVQFEQHEGWDIFRDKLRERICFFTHGQKSPLTDPSANLIDL